MKVLFLTYSPSPYRVDFFEELSKYVDLTVCYETSPSEDKTKRNSNWYGKNKNSYNSIYLKNRHIFSKYISFDIKQIIKYNKFDLIIVSGYSSLTSIYTINYLKFKKIPFVLNCDGGFPKYNEKKIKYLLKKHLIKQASYYLSTGKKTTEYLKYYGANEDRIYNYPFTSIRKNEMINEPLTKIEKIELKNELNLNNKFIILSIGQFIKRKGMDTVIKASKLINENTEVIIIGDKPTEEYLNLINTQKNQNIKFIDFKPKYELIKYIKAADVFVLATREDIWGLVINEALSFGIPVITTTKCGAGVELIKNGENGFLIEPENEIELSKIINYLSSNSKELDKMSKKALETMKEYTIENEAKTCADIFDKIIKEK